jgi:hypothetical protein
MAEQMNEELQRLLNDRRLSKNKFGATRSHCNMRHYHQSIFEAGYCNQLGFLLQAGEIKTVEYQKPFRFDINGVHITNYIADFYVEDNEGHWAVHETKGFVTDLYRIKKRLFEALYPEIPFHEIK